MNLKLLVTCLALGSATAFAQVTTSFNFSIPSGEGIVPDDNASGWVNPQSITIPGNGPITDVKVLLNISGGANSDLYAYLSGPNGGFSVLLDQVGKTSGNSIGYVDTGFNVTFSDSAPGDIHTYQSGSYSLSSGQLTGTWQPDARNVGPAPTFSVDNGTARTAFLNSFVNSSPDGAWKLFVADLSSGGQSTVVSWGMQITAVPEPGQYALAAALGLVGFAVVKRIHRSNLPGESGLME